MKNNPKLTFIAATILQALLLFMPISVFANTGGEEEVGIPQAMESRVKVGFGAVMSPDGERYYTVHESGVITQYQINPFKKLSELAFDREKLIDFYKNKSFSKVLITSDEKKLFVLLPSKLIQIDLQNGRILREHAPWEDNTVGGIWKAIMNGNDLVLFERWGGDVSHGLLSVLDADTLARKRVYSRADLEFNYNNGETISLTKYKGRIYLASVWSFVVLNSETYRDELKLSYSSQGWGGAKISRDHNVLYLQGGRKMFEFLNVKPDRLDAALDNKNNVLVYDLRTRASRIESVDNIPKETFDRFFLHPYGASRVKDFILFSNGLTVSSGGIIDLAKDKLYRFYQYDSGESILMECLPPSRKECGNFQLTSGARKYLLMKNSEGKVVPINDATFGKYYRKTY